MTKFLTWSAVTGGLLGLYLVVVRPWQLRWGATDEEVGRALPGDALVASPEFNATRAVSIAAAPAKPAY